MFQFKNLTLCAQVFLISNASATISPVHNMEPHGASATMWLLCTNNVGFRGALQHASVDGGLHFSAIFVGNRCLYITWKTDATSRYSFLFTPKQPDIHV